MKGRRGGKWGRAGWGSNTFSRSVHDDIVLFWVPGDSPCRRSFCYLWSSCGVVVRGHGLLAFASYIYSHAIPIYGIGIGRRGVQVTSDVGLEPYRGNTEAVVMST